MRRRITAVAALELPCAPEAALPTLWDIQGIERSEVKADRVWVRPTGTQTGTYDARGRFAGIPWNGRLDAEVEALTELILSKSRYAIRRSKFVLRNAADGSMRVRPPPSRWGLTLALVRATSTGSARSPKKVASVMDLRKKSSAMWADQRI